MIGLFIGHASAEAPIAPPATLKRDLIAVCTCESDQGTGKPQQYDIQTGNVLHGRINPNDIGMCQINVQPNNGHLKMSLKLGWDIYTEQGNIKYANWLYHQEGLTPWNSSKGCWAK